ncbi:MAG: hypothetical protein LBB18_02995 [Puniceicoccales bacterium]|nr:hypothetical protein [Puniceicoccales bacterium]
MNQYRRQPWTRLKFIDVVIDGQHLDVVDDWGSIEIIDDRYWFKLVEDLRKSVEIVVTVDENGLPVKLSYRRTNSTNTLPCVTRDREKIRQIIDLCEKNNICYEIAI